jgi:NAD(P)H-flavin reductase
MSKFFLKNKINTSFFGDMHPNYTGSVVKALASTKHGFPHLLEHLKKNPPKHAHLKDIKKQLSATVVSIEVLAPDIIELVIHAPLAAQNFQPGQFYKLQNFEVTARLKKKNYSHLLEPLALTGASVDKEKGLISFIILQNGTSSLFCSHLSVGEEVSLMGPTGEPTAIPSHKNVLLLGGGLGNAVLFSIAHALKEKNNKVYYFAAYKTQDSRFKTIEIERSSDRVFWVCEDMKILKNREQDATFQGNIIDALHFYKDILKDIDHVIAIGSDGMMRAVAKARFHTLKHAFLKNPPLIGSINSPMQCMMKGICGQCVQVHKDATGAEYVVFSCQNQDQSLESLDFNCLKNRLEQNSLQEKLNKAVMQYL